MATNASDYYYNAGQPFRKKVAAAASANDISTGITRGILLGTAGTLTIQLADDSQAAEAVALAAGIHHLSIRKITDLGGLTDAYILY